ncbi:MAG: 4,5-dioxygenase [Rhodospirillales bacterium]|nr:4,5-dioxygenase [Rhodospirillales bacterium]
MPHDQQIDGFHAHVYYSTDAERQIAAEIRTFVEENHDVTMGRWRDQAVGPHPQPMYQIAFANPEFDKLVPWLMLNRQGLNILIHPNTSDAVRDHRDFPIWLGDKLPLNIAFLEAGNSSA